MAVKLIGGALRHHLKPGCTAPSGKGGRDVAGIGGCRRGCECGRSWFELGRGVACALQRTAAEARTKPRSGVSRATYKLSAAPPHAPVVPTSLYLRLRRSAIGPPGLHMRCDSGRTARGQGTERSGENGGPGRKGAGPRGRGRGAFVQEAERHCRQGALAGKARRTPTG